MKVYFGNSLGCTLWAIALTVLFFVTAGVFIKLLITTPLGLILLALMAFGYYRNRKRIRDFTNTGGFYWTNSMNNDASDFGKHSNDSYSNISGAPNQDGGLRSNYECTDDVTAQSGIDRSSYQDVEDAEFVEIHDQEKR